ncbi:hypothetical protein Hanom_Chr06g00487911 [Helianthus anomalus]
MMILEIKGIPTRLPLQNNLLQLPPLNSLSTSLHRLNVRKEPAVEQLKKYRRFNPCLFLEEGEIVSDLSHEQLLALNAMKDIDDDEIEKMPIEPETKNAENVEEIVFEGETNRPMFVPTEWSLIHLMKNG